jgi:hypothetical protein
MVDSSWRTCKEGVYPRSELWNVGEESIKDRPVITSPTFPALPPPASAVTIRTTDNSLDASCGRLQRMVRKCISLSCCYLPLNGDFLSFSFPVESPLAVRLQHSFPGIFFQHL